MVVLLVVLTIATFLLTSCQGNFMSLSRFRQKSSIGLPNPTSVHSLLARRFAVPINTTNIPDQCKSDCQDIIPSLNVRTGLTTEYLITGNYHNP